MTVEKKSRLMRSTSPDDFEVAACELWGDIVNEHPLADMVHATIEADEYGVKRIVTITYRYPDKNAYGAR